MNQDAKPPSGAASTLGKAAEASRESYHGDAAGASKRPPGRKDPQVGKAGDKTIKQD